MIQFVAGIAIGLIVVPTDVGLFMRGFIIELNRYRRGRNGQSR